MLYISKYVLRIVNVRNFVSCILDARCFGHVARTIRGVLILVEMPLARIGKAHMLQSNSELWSYRNPIGNSTYILNRPFSKSLQTKLKRPFCPTVDNYCTMAGRIRTILPEARKRASGVSTARAYVHGARGLHVARVSKLAVDRYGHISDLQQKQRQHVQLIFLSFFDLEPWTARFLRNLTILVGRESHALHLAYYSCVGLSVGAVVKLCCE